MKKRVLVIAASLISAFSIAIATISIKNRISINRTNGETVTYTMTLDKNNRISNVATNGDEKQGVVKTALGSEIEMVYTSTISDPTGQDFLVLNGTTQTLKNKSPINGVSRIDYQVIGALSIQYSYSYEGQADSKFIGEDSEQVSGTVTFGDGEGFPSYFKFASVAECHIIFLKFYYSCTPSVDPHASTGSWTYESNSDGEGVYSSVTLTGYTNPSAETKAAGILVVPENINDGGTIRTVTRINANVLNNVGWVKHIVVPFIGQTYLLDKTDLNNTFGSIFSTSSGNEDYEIMAQGTYSWYVPKSLRKVTIYKGNKESRTSSNYVIPNSAFYSTSKLDEININANISSIGANAFAYNTTINKLYLPSSVTEIGNNAFANCPYLIIRSRGLLEITHDMNPTNCPYSIGYVDTVVENNIVYDICKDGENRLYGNAIRLNNQNAETVDFKATFNYEGYTVGTKRIANQMLLNNSSVRMIILPNYLEYVGYNAFKDAYRATIYATENESSVYKTGWRDGVGGYFNNCHDTFYEKKGIKYAWLTNGIVIYDVNYEASEQTPETLDFKNVEPISTGDLTHFAAAFLQNNTDVETIYVDYNVRFAKYSFSGCTNLTDIYFNGDISQWDYIVSLFGTNAFAGVNATVHCTNGDTTFDGTSMAY